jgi:peptidyl-prolyl cis-trans isomerase C
MKSFKNGLPFKGMIALALILVSTAVLAADKKTSSDRVAVVNGVNITSNDFNRALSAYMERVAQRGQKIPEPQMAELKNAILENLIVGELLFQESKQKGIEVNAADVTEQLQGIKQRFPSETEFKKVLDENQITESDLQAQIKRDLAIKQLIDKEVGQRVIITDEESKTYYDTHPQSFVQPEQVRASHILIKVATDATEAQKIEARKKIADIQQKLQKGEDFATLAQNYSEDSSSKKGGDLGYFERGQMIKPFEDAAFSLKPNETSGIVETQFGYHIIKVVDKKPEEKVTYAEAKDRLNQYLKQQKIQSEEKLYIDNLKKNAAIEKFL